MIIYSNTLLCVHIFKYIEKSSCMFMFSIFIFLLGKQANRNGQKIQSGISTIK